MNQILFMESKKAHSAQEIKKIVLFFSITIIIFGLILLGQGAYAVFVFFNENKDGKTSGLETDIQINQIDDENVRIKAESSVGISELIYSWNNNSSQTISENGKKSIQETIKIPSGENDLIIKIIDLNGKQITKNEKFTSVLPNDTLNIELSIVGDNIKISVKSENNISYVTYKWNSEEEQKIEMTTYEDKTKLEKELEIPKGSNTLKVTAVDEKNNTAEKSQEIKGVTKPKSAPVIQGKYIYFEVTADEDIKQVDFTFNNVPYIIKENTIKESGQSRKVIYRLKLQKGMNYLVIKTTTVSGITGEDVWKYEYKK